MIRVKQNTLRAAGFSAVEIMLTLAIMAILSAFAIPSLSEAMRDMQLLSDARNVSSALTYARQKAKSMMTPYRLEFDLENNRWSLQRYDGSAWEVEQDVNQLSNGLAGSGTAFKETSESSPIASLTDSSTHITFNSRGIPVDGTTPSSDNIVFISKSDTDYAITVTLPGKVQIWRKNGEEWDAI